MTEGWAPGDPRRRALPRVEDLPVAPDGYDREAVERAFDAFYRHAAELDSTLRALEAVDAFSKQAADLRADIRTLRAASWGPLPGRQTWASQYAAHAAARPRGFLEVAPRLAVEAAFIILVAVGAALADLRTTTVVLVVIAAWLVVGLAEVIASLARPSPPPTWRAAARPVPAEAPAAPTRVVAPPAPAPAAPPVAPAPIASDPSEDTGEVLLPDLWERAPDMPAPAEPPVVEAPEPPAEPPEREPEPEPELVAQSREVAESPERPEESEGSAEEELVAQSHKVLVEELEPEPEPAEQPRRARWRLWRRAATELPPPEEQPAPPPGAVRARWEPGGEAVVEPGPPDEPGEETELEAETRPSARSLRSYRRPYAQARAQYRRGRR